MEYLTVGRIVNTHGIRGEVRVLSRTDFPEIRFRPGNVLYVDMPDQGIRGTLEIETSRVHKNLYLLRFKGLAHINDVEKYKGAWLKVPSSDKVELEEDEYYFHEIIGCDVVTEAGEAIGTVTEILQPGANDVWVAVTPEKREILIPVIPDVVLDVDVDMKKITIRLMEGML